jgi:hypothetical protein
MTIETILPTPDIFCARRVLCIQPQYYDNDIAVAGTLQQLWIPHTTNLANYHT